MQPLSHCFQPRREQTIITIRRPALLVPPALMILLALTPSSVVSAQTQRDLGQDQSVIVYEDGTIANSEPTFRPSTAKLSLGSSSSSSQSIDDPQADQASPRPPLGMDREATESDRTTASQNQTVILQAAPRPPKFPQEDEEATYTSNQDNQAWDGGRRSAGPVPRVNPSLFQQPQDEASDPQAGGSNRPVSLDPMDSSGSFSPLRPRELGAATRDEPADTPPSMSNFSDQGTTDSRIEGRSPISDPSVMRASFNQEGGNSFGGPPPAQRFQPQPPAAVGGNSAPSVTSPPAQPMPFQGQAFNQQRSSLPTSNQAFSSPSQSPMDRGNDLRATSPSINPLGAIGGDVNSITPEQRTAAIKKQQRDQLKPALDVAKGLLNRFDIDGHNTIPGTPVTLVDMMREPISNSRRDEMIHQYWETFYDWAALNIAREHQGWAQSLPTNVASSELALVETAKRIAQDRMLAAEIQMGKSQSRLLDFFANPRSDDFLPMPSDLPTVSPDFNTNFDWWKQRGAISSNFRGIDQMLDGTIRLTAQRAATVTAARRARSEVLAAVSGRQASLSTAIQSAELCRTAELDMVASVVAYNQAIGHYMLAVEPTKPAEQLVSSMIGTQWMQRMNLQSGQPSSVFPGMPANSAIAGGQSIMNTPRSPSVPPERTARVDDLPLRSDFR